MDLLAVRDVGILILLALLYAGVLVALRPPVIIRIADHYLRLSSRAFWVPEDLPEHGKCRLGLVDLLIRGLEAQTT